MESLKIAFCSAQTHLLLFDYDGTLVEFAPLPEQAKPPARLLKCLRQLASNPANKVVVVSGRPPETLDEWLGATGVDLSAEHGQFIKFGSGDWQQPLKTNQDWKAPIREQMEQAAHKVAKSFVEEKHTSLVWHFRRSSQRAAEPVVRDLIGHLKTEHQDLNISLGHKVVEARLASANKGSIVKFWDPADYDFVLAAGDDVTDEDLFAAMPKPAFTAKIGTGQTIAKHRFKNPGESYILTRIRTPLSFLSCLENTSLGVW